MHILNSRDVAPFTSPNGESVQELGGHSAGGLVQHSLAQITLRPGGKSARHYHPVAEESYFILSGRARVVVGDETRELKAGDMLAIPATVIHQILNDSAEEVVFLAVCVPPWTPDCSVFLDDDA